MARSFGLKKTAGFLAFMLVFAMVFTAAAFCADANPAGDMDENGETNITDVQYLLKDVNGQTDDLEDDLADANGDDTVNISDVQLLLQYVNGQNVNLGRQLVLEAFWEDYDAEDTLAVTWRVPKIDLESSEIEDLNQEIWNTMYGAVTQNHMQDDEIVYSTIDYVWYANDDILSLVMMLGDDPDEITYYIYNVSVSDETPLTDSDVLSSLGYTQEEYEELVRQALVSHTYDESGRDMFELVDMVGESYWDEVSEMVSDDNVALACPYVNGDGHLCAAVPWYGIFSADTEYSYRLLDLEDFELDPTYDDVMEQVS